MVESNAFALLVAVIAVLTSRALYHHSKLRRIKAFRDVYEAFLIAGAEDPMNFEIHGAIAEEQPEVVKLFRQAGLKDSKVPTVKAFTPINARLYHPSAWENLANTTEEIVYANRFSISKTIGFFRARRNETLSPVFWIESFIQWPRIVAGWLGYDSDAPILKILSLVILVLESLVALREIPHLLQLLQN